MPQSWTPAGGGGLLLGGVPGTSAAKVTIIGGGVAGTEAAKMSYRPGRRRAQAGLPRDGQRPLVRVA